MDEPRCECGHYASEHTFWNGCTRDGCNCQKTQVKAFKIAYYKLLEQLDNYEKEAPCGHPERYWKVEANQDAWCTLCAALANADENVVLNEELEEAIGIIEDLLAQSGVGRNVPNPRLSSWEKRAREFLDEMDKIK